MTPQPESLVTTLEFDLAQPTGSMVSVSTTLCYDATDPYAVRAVFVVGGCAIEWVFARDLLADGLRSLSGAGDVTVWSYVEGGTRYVWIGLSSPTGRALLRGREVAVHAFLQQTYAMVPAGAESGCLDLDREMQALLGRA